MDMQEFLNQYVENMLGKMREGARIDTFSFICDLCPLRAQCEKDTQDNPDDNSTCGMFIKRTVTDGSSFEA